MSGLTLTLTHAGRAALINAEHTGTAPVTITQVGVTSTAFDPAPTAASVPGEIKRLSTLSGKAIAADTVHITIRDDSTASYTLRGFGLYLDDGTLFAVYSQSGAIMQKSAQSLLLLSVDIKLLQVAASSVTFGNANFLNPPATTSVQGVIELATTTEAKAGTDTARAITPATLKTVLDTRLPDDMAGKVDKISTAPNDISERIDSGFYQQSTPGPGWPVQESQWWHLISLTHNNPGNYYALQLACKYGGHGLMFRNTANNGNAPWHTLWHSGNFDPGSRLKLTGGTLSGNLSIAREGEAQLRLKSTSANGREIILLSSPTPNTGFYDATNGQWLLRIDANNLASFKGVYGESAVYAYSTGNAHYWLRDETGQKRGLVYWNRSTDAVYLQRYDPDTEQVKGRLRINADGTVTSDYAISAPLFTGKATSADKLNSSTKINGTSFNGTADIITARWGAERTLKIGNASKLVNGSGNVTWTLAEIGAAAASHGHAWSAITDKPAQALRWPKWGEVSEKPASFPPASHGHVWGAITDKPAQATRWPKWGEVSEKPTAFPPSSHGHAWSAITDKPAQATRWPKWGEVSEKPGDLVTQSDYTSSKTGNGWMKRPDGIIEQWGLYVLYTNSEITRSVTFPIAFPNACWNVTVTDINPPVSNKDKYDLGAQVNQGSLTATGFSVFIQAPGGVGNNWQGMYWRAIGH